ncbi:hypothetical protein OIU91_39415 [Streptomyces sp. NBC_01456]|uniref:hypothetical protein n=1 Tax=unclassified Streptomyces TaxID=2593676 RepID=UPI002E373984|nr:MULTISPECIES: hypothetical protein [unclassified Streptomyces]
MVLPWDMLDAAGLFRCRQGADNSGHRLMSPELCPAGRWFGEHERPAGYLRPQDLIS